MISMIAISSGKLVALFDDEIEVGCGSGEDGPDADERSCRAKSAAPVVGPFEISSC